MSKALVRVASPEEVDAFFHHAAWTTHVIGAGVLVKDGVMLGMGSFTVHDGRKWVYLDLTDEAKPHALRMLRAIKRVLANQPDDIYAVCNKAQHRGAPALLTRLGFEPTGEILEGQEVWRWSSRH